VALGGAAQVQVAEAGLWKVNTEKGGFFLLTETQRPIVKEKGLKGKGGRSVCGVGVLWCWGGWVGGVVWCWWCGVCGGGVVGELVDRKSVV
jgi:hypothetical protein